MENQNANIRVSISEGLVEISGSETFVSSQIDNLKEILKDLKECRVKTKPLSIVGIGGSQKNEEQKSAGYSISEMDDIYVVDDEKLKIICDEIPGDEKSTKTFNVALLYAFATKQLGKEEANVEEIREICNDHGCLDSTNFSTHIKNGNPQYYIDKGAGKSRTIRINKPGEKKAKELIEVIRQNVASNS